MKRPLAYYGDPILRKKASSLETIDDSIRQLVQDMYETMIYHNGCGLAAPQVHESIALFITYVSKEKDGQELPPALRVFINPKILSYSKEMWPLDEACLSIPKIRETVDRPLTVTIQAMDLEGNIFTETFEKYEAHVVMHENDHLNGVLYIDRLPPKKRKAIQHQLKQISKQVHK